MLTLSAMDDDWSDDDEVVVIRLRAEVAARGARPT